MNRRQLLKAMAGVSVSAVGAASRPTAKKYGLVTVKSERAHRQLTGETLHVLVDGVDVTRDCYEADDVNRYALVFCRDQQDHKKWMAQGHLHVGGDDHACKMRLNGHVVIAPDGSL